MKRFDMSCTVTEQEILEEYFYRDKEGSLCETQIVIKIRKDGITSVINFKDITQYTNFVPPSWLVILNSVN